MLDDLKIVNRSKDSPLEIGLKFVLHWEGGYGNHPLDRGGATNYGISYKFLKDQERDNVQLLRSCGINPPITNDLIKNLTLAQVAALYKACFWMPCKCDVLPLGVAMFLFDAAVNCGVGTSIRLAQRAGNRYQQQTNLIVDGKLGPKTLSVLTQMDNKMGWLYLSEVRKERYANIIVRNPSQKVFERGWIRRIKSLQNFVKLLFDGQFVQFAVRNADVQ